MLSLLISILVPAIWTCGAAKCQRSEVGAGTDVLSHLEDGEDVVVLGADVAVTTERRHRHGVGVQHRQVVAVAAVNDPDTAVAGRKPPRENRNEGGGEDDLEGKAGLEK